MLLFFSVPRSGLEPEQPKGHQPLKLARLPISPPGLVLRDNKSNKYVLSAKR